MTRPAFLLGLALLAGCQSPKVAPAASVDAGPPPAAVVVNPVAKAMASAVVLDADDPRTCAVCHEAIVAEWEESLHARAHHQRDPVYAAMRSFRIEKQGPGIPAKCARCHNPRDRSDMESAAARTGVSCATCHQLDGVHGGADRKGADALQFATAVRFRAQSDIPDGTSPVHGNGPALPAIKDGASLCLACHGEEHNPAGVPTCSTGVEHASVPGNQSCVSCHMEEVPSPSGAVSPRLTHRSHRFRGPNHALRSGAPGLLAEAVTLSGRFDGKELVVNVSNGSGHSFPTGFPGRTAIILVRGLDAGGREVYRNIRADPMADSPQAVLGSVYGGDDGTPTLPPFATRKLKDTRLTPAEQRELRFPVPSSARSAELTLQYLLFPAKAAAVVGYQGPETRPISLAPVTVLRELVR